MKAILSLIVSGALVVSGFGQTRNVLVGTNNAVVQPTNFWSADAVNARSGLGLGSAATNPASAFQPSSLTLTNLSANNGGSLTNLTASNVVGTLSLGQGGTGATNAADARTALGLGTAATNPASAFQPSSANLTNLAANNGTSLTNLQASNIFGTLPVSSGGTGATNATNARQNLGATATGAALFTATDASAARTSLGATTVGANIFTLNVTLGSTNFLRLNADNTVSALSAADMRSSLLLGTAATNAATNFQPASSALTSLSTNNGVNLTNIPVAGVVNALASNGNAINLTNFPTVALASNVTGTIAISNGGSGATTAGGARTNLGLGTTNEVAFGSVIVGAASTRFAQSPNGGVGLGWQGTANRATIDTTLSLNDADMALAFGTNNTTGAAITRTNLGLGWSALTNTTTAEFNTSLYGSGTNPVLYNTNGEVVSPTNFWQAAPITATFIETQPTTNQTTNMPAGRNLHIHSLAISTTGVTNTIALPTNPATTFDGDIALVVHQGPTSSVTAVRQAGAGTNLITLNRLDEAVEFIYYNDEWEFNHNQAFIEPIYFSGTNASANAAASVTNLFTPNTPLVLNTNGQVIAPSSAITFTNEINITSGRINIGNGVGFWDEADGTYALFFQGDDPVLLNSRWDDDSVRSALGLGLPALTNTNVTNFRSAIGLGATNEVQFDGILLRDNSEIKSESDGSGTLVIDADETILKGFISFNNTADAATTRTNLGLGATNDVTFENVIANGIFSGTNAATDLVLDTQNWALYANTNIIADWDANFFLINVPVQFNNTTNAAATRTNLGLGATNSVVFGEGEQTNVGVGVGSTQTGLASGGAIQGRLGLVHNGNTVAILDHAQNPHFGLYRQITFQGADASANAAATRTNLGLPLPALTATNNAAFQAAVFVTNTVPTNSVNVNSVNFNTAIHWMEVNVVTNGVTNNFRIPLFK